MSDTASDETSSVPCSDAPQRVGKRTAILVASGDLRRSANVACWPAQQAVEHAARDAFEALGWTLVRGHPERWSDDEPHGFIGSQRQGRDVFATIDRDAPLVVVEAVWQYSHHVLMGLERHRGPILILANWSGQWPGLVGALNLRGSLTKAGVKYSMLWAESFDAPDFRRKLREWLDTGRVRHDTSHVRRLERDELPKRARRMGRELAAALQARPAILGVFDEGCMGMFNAIVPDHLLHPIGMYKERLSQSSLYYAMTQVPDREADECRAWLDKKGMRFHVGKDEATHLTDRQVREQCKMYIAAARIADEFGCDAIGIQYQQGLKDLAPASDLAEGLLNCSDRPPVVALSGPNAGQVIRAGEPITHFNEADECAAIDGVLTQRAWTALGLAPDNTLHDLRWGDVDRTGTTDEYVWVFEISGAVPPSHLDGGYAGAVSERQPPMYFRLGGGTIKGVSKPGEVVWSRVFVAKDRLHMDIGRCRAITLPREETERRWDSTTPQWPIMHAIFYGVTRDQMMARHQANHIQVAYAPTAKAADRALAVKAAMAEELGIRVWECGETRTAG
ncbi:MAG: fucose isomerase [Phycisphaerales bacterium]